MLLTGFIVAFLLWPKRSQLPIRLTLSDGSEIQVLKLAYGNQLYLGDMTLWDKLLLTLPSSFRPSSFIPPVSFSTENPSLLMLFTVQGPATNYPVIFEITDENGFKGPRGWGAAQGAPGGVFVFPTFPRRARNLTLKFHGYSNHANFASEGETSFRNNFKFAEPPWRADKLPSERNAGDLTVRLLDAVWNSNYNEDPARSKMPPTVHQSFLQFEMQNRNQPTTNWEIVSVVCDDASGNHLEALPGRKVASKGRPQSYSLWLHDSLLPTEPIRYRLEMARRDAATTDTVILRNIPIPPERAKSRTTATNEHGLKAAVEMETFIANSLLLLRIEAQGITGQTNLMLLRLTDDQGRELNRQSEKPQSPNKFLRDSQEFEVVLRPGVKTLTVEVAIQKSLWMEFFAQPRVVSTNEDWVLPQVYMMPVR